MKEFGSNKNIGDSHQERDKTFTIVERKGERKKERKKEKQKERYTLTETKRWDNSFWEAKTRLHSYKIKSYKDELEKRDKNKH